MKSFNGYKKKNLTDVNVLLSGGGEKSLGNFIGSLNWDSTNRKLQYKSASATTWSDLVTFGERAMDSTAYLPLSGGTLTGALTIKGVTDTGQYSQGGFNKAYANIILQGDNTYGVSGIVFKSMKANDTSINTPSDVAFIQYHPMGVTASAYNTTPTEASSGERSRLVIGIGNDADNGSSSVGEELWLQTAGANDLKHYVVNTVYTILDSGNYSSYALPLSGGSLSGSLTGTRIWLSHNSNLSTSYSWTNSALTVPTIEVQNYTGTTESMYPTITLHHYGYGGPRIGSRQGVLYIYGGDTDARGLGSKNTYFKEMRLYPNNDGGLYVNDAQVITTGNIGSQSVNYSASTGSAPNSALPQRLKHYTSQYNVGSPDNFTQTGFAYGSGGTNAPYDDYNLIGIFHTDGGWGHQIGFKFNGNGTTGTGYDGKDLCTRLHYSNQYWTPWYTILTSGNVQNFALPITGGTLTGQLIVDVNTTYPIKFKGMADYSVLNFCDRNGTWRADFGWLNDNRGNVAYMAGSGVISCDSTAPYYSPNTSTFKTYTIYHTGNLTNLNQLTNGPGYLTLSTLPYRLQDHTNISGQYVSNPNDFMVSGFAYSSGGSPNGSDCHIMTIAHNTNGWCHQLCFKFGGAGLTGASHDGKQLWTRMYHQGNNTWTAWYEILTSATAQYYSLPITGGTLYANNNWLNPARLQLLRPGTSTYSDRACVGVTDGNLHIDAYHNKDIYMNYYSSGNIRFGYQTSSYYITPSGVTYFANYYTTSDRSKKQNISSFSEHIRKFQLKDTEKWHYGVIAQEVPEMFREGKEGEMTVNYNSILSYYVGILENKNKELEQKISVLENDIKQLKNKI